MSLDDYSNTDFNSKKKPLVGNGTPTLANLATKPAQTSAPSVSPTQSLAQSPISASQSPIQKPVLSNLSAPTKLVGAPVSPQQSFTPPTPTKLVNPRGLTSTSESDPNKSTPFVVGVGSRMNPALSFSQTKPVVPDQFIGAIRGQPNQVNPAYTDYMKARQPAPTAAPSLVGTQPLRNIQVPPESAMDVKNMSLGQMANRQSLVGSKKSVEQMMATTTLPPAPTGTQAAMSPVNSPNRITAALNDLNNYHDHLMQLSKNAGVSKFQPNLDYSADMNAMPKKLAGTPQVNQNDSTNQSSTPKLAGTFNGENVYKNDNGSITLSSGKTLNDSNRLAAAREVLPAYAIDKLRNEALYNHDANALDALVKVNAGNQTHQQAADNLGFEKDKFGKTNELTRQSQDATQKYNQGVLDNQNRQTAVDESKWEHEKASKQFEATYGRLKDDAMKGDKSALELLPKIHAMLESPKKEKLKTSYKDAMGNEVENERLVDGDKASSVEETRDWVDQIAQSMQPKDR